MTKYTIKSGSDLLMLYNILQYASDWIYWKDLNLIHLGCNEQFALVAGFKHREEMIGKSDYECAWSNRAKKYNLDDKEVIQSGKPKLNIEDTVLMNDGTEVIVISNKIPLRNEQGKVIGILGIATDITERKRTEDALYIAKLAAEAANQAKTEFLSNMRHDIRTPLSGIVGFSEILKTESNEPRIKEYADNLVASSHALLDLMDEVLEAVRVSSGEIPLLKRKFNLTETFEQVVALCSAKAQEKRLNLSLELNSDLPYYVIGDKIRLHRIALELVGNALNFTDSGHVILNVCLAKKEENRLIIKMTVSDTGMGIPKNKQQEIYLQFKRLTPSYQGIYKGSGLGLYIVKQFIDELDGEIYVESESSKGTVFTCLIPLKESLLDDDIGVDKEALITEKPFLTPITYQKITEQPIVGNKPTSTILVVEDNFIAQKVAKALLSSMDCTVDVAANGADAISLCEQKHYDLIFMDIGLGEGMDGYEVTHHIRSQGNTKQHIPIIALTAHGGDESRQRCIEAGMDAVLTKPLTITHAKDIIKTFIPARHEAPSLEEIKARRDLPDNDDEMFQLNQFALLDDEEALKNCGTLTMLTEMLEVTIQALPADLECMKNAYHTNDFPLVEKTAHKIKGGAVYIGTTRMKYACQYVERYWKSGERDLFEALYHQAVTTIEETNTLIEGWLQKQTP